MRAIRRVRRRASVVAGAALVSVGLAAAGTQALAAPEHRAAIVGNSELSGVSCGSGKSCWAVGSAELNDVTRNQILRFSDRRWSPVRAPSPGGSASGDTSGLAAVWCTATANCWAVGGYDKDDASLTQALHWNGHRWSQVATPSPGGTRAGDSNHLADVVCTSAVSCWADGDDGHPIGRNDVQFNLVLHWNGRRWSHTRTPNPGGGGAGDVSALSAIRCTSVASCWGVGTYGRSATSGASTFDNEVLHWNGRTWGTVTVPSPGAWLAGRVSSGLNAVSCASAGSFWAAGSDSGTSGSLYEALHWNGRKWQTVGVPSPSSGADAFNELSGASCAGGTN
jgi:hypothetical protein